MKSETTNPSAPKNDREFQVWEDGRQQGIREGMRATPKTTLLEWDAKWPPPPGEAVRIEAIVRTDIANSLCDLEHPSKLVFHHVQLTDSLDEPMVFVYGRKGSDAFHLRYDAAPEWGPIGKEIQNG